MALKHLLCHEIGPVCAGLAQVSIAGRGEGRVAAFSAQAQVSGKLTMQHQAGDRKGFWVDESRAVARAECAAPRF